MNEPISSIEPVDLKSIWPNESRDFTPWLARAENLERLGDELGIKLEPRETERSVGSFSADIVCSHSGRTDAESWTVIENQYGRTDHDHLGKLLVYAAGIGAKTVIWIAEEFRDEHKAALDMLNESTTSDRAYFGVEIEILRIDDSRPAPRFNTVVQPNDWLKPSSGPSEMGRLQIEFWRKYKELLAKDGGIRTQKAGPWAYMLHTVGRSGVHICSTFTTWNSAKETYSIGEIRAALELTGPNRRDVFNHLNSMRDTVEGAAGRSYVWQPWESANTIHIMIRRDADVKDRDRWPEYQSWLQNEVKLIADHIVPIAKKFAA
ncbi:MAG: DUF4268 domain-containing protein [Chloroflexota bacterium]|nr:DUF4268 domain-containing protein [Chloroflexota bacterium]